MTKRFVLSTDPLTKDEEKKLKERLGRLAWWHWLPNFWLFVDKSETFTTEKIRDEVHKVNTSARCIVLEVEAKDWSALTLPNSAGKPMEGWIESVWSRD